MRHSRRQFLSLASGAVALPALSAVAMAQSYPARPVRIVVGFAAGGNFDIVARLVGQSLGERLHQPVIIENRPGASGNLATEMVLRAPADGHTLLFGGAVNAINASLYEKLSFNFVDEATPVAGIARFPNVVAVNASFPAASVSDLIAYAKEHPGKINYGSSGVGTTQHLAGELFNMMTGAGFTHVPYRGAAPALTDLLGGQVQLLFEALPPSLQHIKSGKLRALAVTTATRSEVLPDVPSVGEILPGYEASGWNGICAPRNTPPDIVEKLNKAINAALAEPALKARLTDLGASTIAGSSADFGKLIAHDTEKWAKVIRNANIKVSG